MAVLQSLVSPKGSFADVAKLVFNITTAAFQMGAQRIDFVVDQYPQVSIKTCERNRRSQQGVLKVLINHRDQPCPLQWKKYLSLDENKVALVSFLVKEWSRPEYAASLQHRSLFVTHGNYCTKMSSTDGLSVETSAVVELECTHEEADTRMLFHAAHASSLGSRTIVIRSPDTDVAILAVVLCRQFAQGSRMFFRTGTKHRVRYIDVFALRRKLGEQVRDALLGLRSLTGCDSTIAFKNCGKKPGLELLISNPGLVKRSSVVWPEF